MKNIEHYKLLRNHMISNRVTELMKDNPDIPVTDNYSIELPMNIKQYMIEVGNGDIEDITGIKEIIAYRRDYSTDKFMEVLGRRFYCGLQEYWERMAEFRAEHDIPSITELMEQDQSAAEQDSDNRRDDARMEM